MKNWDHVSTWQHLTAIPASPIPNHRRIGCVATLNPGPSIQRRVVSPLARRSPASRLLGYSATSSSPPSPVLRPLGYLATGYWLLAVSAPPSSTTPSTANSNRICCVTHPAVAVPSSSLPLPPHRPLPADTLPLSSTECSHGSATNPPHHSSTATPSLMPATDRYPPRLCGKCSLPFAPPVSCRLL
jgi:hypothetical protein